MLNFHRCRDKIVFPSILEILCELNVYICDIVTMYKGNDTFFLRIPINYINIKRDIRNWFESEGFTRIENIIEQQRN